MCGFMGSGKNTAADYLIANGFEEISFADSLKKAISHIFNWDYELLLGKTTESREWREKVDYWWERRLGIPDLTPRWVLQHWGTEVGRNNFHPDIWIASVEKKLFDNKSNVVINDCRFPNEFDSIRRAGGIFVHIVRGKFPEWYETALDELNSLQKGSSIINYGSKMRIKYPDVHISEWGWINQHFDHIIENNGTLEELYQKLDEMLNIHTI